MAEALRYPTWAPPPSSSAPGANSGGHLLERPGDGVESIKIGTSAKKLVAENAVIVFGRSGCCMCHVVRRLLLGHGVNPPVVEVEEAEEAAIVDELSKVSGEALQFPAVFVGGKHFGGLEKVMATHISGELVPILKEAGALWL
ncbi:Thioredoxin-disulfide reductase [Bertholletia excelsa]